MSQREAFEAWAEKDFVNPGHAKFHRSGESYCTQELKSKWLGWQAAIQHASDVAEDCIEHELGETGQAKAIVHAIKEALK